MVQAGGVQAGGRRRTLRSDQDGAVAVETAVVLGLMLVLLIGVIDTFMALSVVEGLQSASAIAERELSIPGTTPEQATAKARSAMFWFASDCISIAPDDSLTGPAQAWELTCHYRSLTGLVDGFIGGLNLHTALITPRS